MFDSNRITVSLEKAKQLKEAGYSQQDSSLFWCFLEDEDCEPAILPLSHPKENELAAPTAEEILRRLPDDVHRGDSSDFHGGLTVRHWNEKWIVSYESNGHKGFPSDTLANAAASMWLHLKKNNLLPVSDV